MHMKLWAKELYEYTSLQNDYDLKLLGPKKVNPTKESKSG